MVWTIGPGYFLEVEKILPLLTANSTDHPSFHVVAPSLPGFAFSEAPKKTGFAGPQYAEVLALVIQLSDHDLIAYVWHRPLTS